MKELAIIPNKQTPKAKQKFDWKKDKELLVEIVNFAKTVKDEAGLAFNQIGRAGLSKERINKRGFICFDHVCLNPKIIKYFGNPYQTKEACKTWPTKLSVAYRHVKIQLEYTDVNGLQITENFEKTEAHVMQHLVDHLNGVETEFCFPNDVCKRLPLLTKKNRKKACWCGSNKKYIDCCTGAKGTMSAYYKPK